MLKGIAYFFIGFVSALIVVEMTNGVPPKKIDYRNLEVRYIYRPYPNHYYYDYGRHPDTFNRQRPYNNSGGYNRSSGEKRTHTPTKTFDHTPQQRTESWGTKN